MVTEEKCMDTIQEQEMCKHVHLLSGPLFTHIKKCKRVNGENMTTGGRVPTMFCTPQNNIKKRVETRFCKFNHKSLFTRLFKLD